MQNLILLAELKDILQTDFGLCLSSDEVSKVADDLVGCFDLLAMIDCNKSEEQNGTKSNKNQENGKYTKTNKNEQKRTKTPYR